MTGRYASHVRAPDGTLRTKAGAWESVVAKTNAQSEWELQWFRTHADAASYVRSIMARDPRAELRLLDPIVFPINTDKQ